MACWTDEQKAASLHCTLPLPYQGRAARHRLQRTSASASSFSPLVTQSRISRALGASHAAPRGGQEGAWQAATLASIQPSAT